MERVMTVKQLLQLQIERIEKIRVPVGLADEIGIPLQVVVKNLKLGMDAINDPVENEEEPVDEEEEEGEEE